MNNPYMKALDDFEELLDNAKSNGGGVAHGSLFIEGAHWDYELRDQVNLLRENKIKEAEDQHREDYRYEQEFFNQG